MFNYMFKNLPSKYVFAGYGVRKGLTILTTDYNGRIIYDVFLYTYIDNYLSFFIQLDNGKYKHVELNVEVPEATAEDLMSKHLARGMLINEEDYEELDKEQLIGVFGLRNMETLMKQIDTLNQNAEEASKVKIEAVMDIKPTYMGMEIMGVINSFNRILKYEKGRITVPPITYGPEDKYKSLIGDEMDFFDFMSNKDSDTIVSDLKKLHDTLDGVGNLRDGVEIQVIKGDEGNPSTVVVNETK